MPSLDGKDNSSVAEDNRFEVKDNGKATKTPKVAQNIDNKLNIGHNPADFKSNVPHHNNKYRKILSIY